MGERVGISVALKFGERVGAPVNGALVVLEVGERVGILAEGARVLFKVGERVGMRVVLKVGERVVFYELEESEEYSAQSAISG